MPERDGSQHCSQVKENYQISHNLGVEAPRRLQEIWIEILGAVRKEHHERHQQDEIKKNLPMTASGAHDRSYGWRAMLFPGLRLAHPETDVERQQGRSASHPEHGAPSQGWQDKPRRHRSQQIANRIPALHNTGQNPAPLSRCTLHGERSPDAPFAAHPDAIDGAQDQKHGVVRSKSAEQFDYRKENHIRHEWFAAAVAIGEQSKDDRAHRPHGQGRSHGPHDGILGDLEMAASVSTRKTTTKKSNASRVQP